MIPLSETEDKIRRQAFREALAAAEAEVDLGADCDLGVIDNILGALAKLAGEN